MSKLIINGTTEFQDFAYIDKSVKSLELDTCCHKYVVSNKVLNDVDRYAVTIPRIYENSMIVLEPRGTVRLTVYGDIMDRSDKSVAYIFDTARCKHIPAINCEDPITAHDIFTIASKNNEEQCFKTTYNRHNGKATCRFGNGIIGGELTGQIWWDCPDRSYRTMFDKAGFGVKIIKSSSDGDTRSITYTNDIGIVIASNLSPKVIHIHHDIYVNNGHGTYYMLHNQEAKLVYNGLRSM